MARITLDHLAHAYGADPKGPQDYALKEIDHVWEQGGAYALLGPSGCGKTTLLNIISGLVRPSRGRILFDERDVTDLPTEARNIAQVFQFPVVYDTMTVRENLAFPLKNRHVAIDKSAARVEEIARLLDLSRVLDRKARNLTADMKQKISLGRGLVRSDVAAILFDEPLTVIDPHLKWQLRSTLKEIHRLLDLTMIYVTHDQTEALTFADKVVVMHDGAVVQTGTPEELFERPAHTFVGHFIGSPGMNVLPCRVDGGTAFIENEAVKLLRTYPALPHGQRIELGIRPEFVQLQPKGFGFPVTVRRIDDIGRARIARVEMAGLAMSASVPGQRVDLGQRGGFVYRYAARSHLCGRTSGDGRRHEALGMKPINNRAWFLVLPVFAIVAFSAILPIMTVVNYSVQDTFGNNQFFWNGVGWFQDLLDPSKELGGRFFEALWRNLLFSAIILAIEVPLGIAVALAMPREGWKVAACLVLMALPLLIPWNVVGTIWQIFARGDIGLLGWSVNHLGIDYNYTGHVLDAWITIIAMDVWHWTSLVALLCYAGLKSIPDAYYQAARIDGASRWAVFRTIQLPKMRRVLLIAVLLRFMDSFMIYTEPFVLTGGGPGNATTFVSIDLVKLALGQFDLGKAAAMSIVYNLIILAVCWIFYTVMTNADRERIDA